MLAVLEFYVSGFWVWLEITFGIALLLHGITIGIGLLVPQSTRKEKETEKCPTGN